MSHKQLRELKSLRERERERMGKGRTVARLLKKPVISWQSTRSNRDTNNLTRSYVGYSVHTHMHGPCTHTHVCNCYNV